MSAEGHDVICDDDAEAILIGEYFMKVQVVTSTKTYEVPEGLLPKVEQNNSERVLRVNLSDTEELVCYSLQDV